MGEAAVEAQSQLKVLVIDDSEIASEVAQEFLREGGYDVRAVTSLGEFTVLLQQWHPHVVLTDVNMPSVSGAELCHWIKSNVQNDDVPVILFSDLPEDELSILAKTSGAEGYLSKTRATELCEYVGTLCQEIVW